MWCQAAKERAGSADPALGGLVTILTNTGERKAIPSCELTSGQCDGSSGSSEPGAPKSGLGERTDCTAVLKQKSVPSMRGGGRRCEVGHLEPFFFFQRSRKLTKLYLHELQRCCRAPTYNSARLYQGGR